MSNIAFFYRPEYFDNMPKAWQDGYAAYKAGKLVIDNPHQCGSVEREDWYDGWKAAEEDQE